MEKPGIAFEVTEWQEEKSFNVYIHFTAYLLV